MRLKWVDFAKGFTILFVVLFHVIDGINKTGLYGGYESISAVLIGLSSLFIMPVFFALSGFSIDKLAILRCLLLTFIRS